jgi:hypothetical protein
LPARYLATSEPFELNVREGDRPAPIQIGAGAPPRQVVTTFTSANLAIIGRTDTTTAVQGAEIVVTALVSGGPERVTAELGGVVVDLVEEAGRWTGVLVVPHDMAVGRAAVVIRATSSEVAATAEVPLTVVASDE